MIVANCLASEDSPSLHQLDVRVESFLAYLRRAGYSEGGIHDKQVIAEAFARWTRRNRIAVGILNESHVTSFVERRSGRSKDRLARELAALRLFLQYLRAQAAVPTPAPFVDSSPAGELERRYVAYLRRERGLSSRSICIYGRLIRDFLGSLQVRFTSPAGLDASMIRDFLLDRVRGRSTESSRLLTTALRSFFRFLYHHGETPTDFSLSVPMFRKWRQSGIHSFLSPEEVERAVSAPDRSTPGGRRDHAILLLLARLGLCAGEVVTIELGDIHWRTGEIVVRGKGRVHARLPLLEDIGEALAVYLRDDRGDCDSRRLFLRKLPPRVGLAGPAAVGHVVRAALARAGIRRSGRGAAHLFRHSLATRMIRHGASIAEIAQVLRHRSQETTAIYAKVAFESLREVARPWPGPGGQQ